MMQQNKSLYSGKVIACCLLISLFLFRHQLQAQQLELKNFVLFSGNPGCTNCGVRVGPSSSVTSGAIGSQGLVKTDGGPQIGGNIHSNRLVDLANETKVTGRITVGNSGPLTQTVLQVGANGTLSGNIDINGSAVIGGSLLQGRLTRPLGSTYSGPQPAGGDSIKTPSIPLLPQLPSLSDLTLPINQFNTDHISGNRNIPKGSYGRITLGGGRKITFAGPGLYVFQSIKNSGSANTFEFDFKGLSGNIRVLVHGDVDLSKSIVLITGGGSAARVFMEVRGTGATSSNGTTAFNISSGSADGNVPEWQGTVWAPAGDIRVGSGSTSSKVVGSLISGRNIDIFSSIKLEHAPYTGCDPTADAGGLKYTDCDNPATTLNGSSNITNALYSWTASNGGNIVSGANTASPLVNRGGLYTLKVTNPECGYTSTDTTTVIFTPCVLPFTDPPPNGKVNEPIGSELTRLNQGSAPIQQISSTIFRIDNSKVLIDVIAKQGEKQNLQSLLQSTDYGLTDLVSNGASSLIITGKFPIANLPKLNLLPGMISYVRPSFPPLSNSGVALSQGDSAMRSNMVRRGFGITGEGIKIGVLSDGFNTLGDSLNNVDNGDLPGIPTQAGVAIVNPFPVRNLYDYPYGPVSDEGRAMMQILHDVAPKAKLAFRTGFITAGDFAMGIRELAADTCKVIVDDITFITEPFFRGGVVAEAIRQMHDSAGVHYVTAAGNFGNKSYEAPFNPVAAPAPLTGMAHSFGTNDVLQGARVRGSLGSPGIYTIVLQWIDDIYSLGNSSLGTRHDLDIYLTDDNGATLFGFNRNNLGGDPIEVLPFVVTANTDINILVVNSNATASQPATGLRFKYVVFRGVMDTMQYRSISSTIVGQGNSPHAITVGAARYKTTPAWGSDTLKIESFSSWGGTFYNNGTSTGFSQKPDIVGPDGVNTTVNMGPDRDVPVDGLSNFFGTSAAAPHVAGAVALLLEAKQRYDSTTLTPAQVKSLLQATALPMNYPDTIAGKGFIQVDAAVSSIANPTPFLSGVSMADSTVQPGADTAELIVKGSFLSSNTVILLGSDTLSTTILSSSEATAVLPPFTGMDSIFAYTPPKSLSGLDGGLSNGISITGFNKKLVVFRADSKSKYYGERLPVLTATITLDGDTIPANSPLIAELGLQDIQFRTLADSSSDVNSYAIRVTRVFTSSAQDSILLSKYTYDSVPGSPGRLDVLPLELTITPVNQTINYGDALDSITYNYTYNSSSIANTAELQSYIRYNHQSIVPSNALAVISGFKLPQQNGYVLSDADLQNLSMMTSFKAISNARRYLVEGNRWAPFPSGGNELNAHYLVDVSAQSFYQFVNKVNDVDLVNAYPGINSRAIVSRSALVQGITNARLPNGQLAPIINGSLAPMINRSLAQIVNGQLAPIINGSLAPIINGSLVQMVNAQLVQMVNGVLEPIPNAQLVQFVNARLAQFVNGTIEYLPDNTQAQMANGSLVQMVNGQLNAVLVNGQLAPIINGSLVQMVNGSLVQMVNGVAETIANRSLVQLVNGQLVQLVNGSLAPIVNGQLAPIINASLVQLVNGQLVQLVNADTATQVVSSRTGVILDEKDTAKVGGWLGAMMGINMITGLDAGEQSLVPGVFINKNFKVKYGIGKVTIQKQVITIKAKDTTKLLGETLVLNRSAFQVTTGSLAAGERIDSVTLTSAGTAGSAGVGTYTISSSMPIVATGIDANNYTFNFNPGTLTVLNNPCLLTHSPFTVFGSTSAPDVPTSLWLSVTTKVSGQLVNIGDFLSFKGGSVALNNITYTAVTPVLPFPDGRIEVANVSAPVTYYDAASHTWITRVPPGYSSTSDIFISGVIINSSNGFKKRNGANTVVKGIFTSNRNFKDQWAFAMAAYRPVFSYSQISATGAVVAVNGTYKAGTPIPVIGSVISGGSGNGGNNYTGSSSSQDNYTACIVDNTSSVNAVTLSRGPLAGEEPARQVELEPKLDVFPNPAKGHVMVSFVPLSKGSSTVTVFTSNGVVAMRVVQLQTEKGRAYIHRVDTQGWVPGLYLVRYENNGKVITKKLMVHR